MTQEVDEGRKKERKEGRARNERGGFEKGGIQYDTTARGLESPQDFNCGRND